MPENEFEKKVSSELQGLKVKPSETVWIRVEERIRKKKKRRVFMIVFLLAGIALLGYWQWDNFLGESKGDITKTETPSQEKNTSANRSDQDTNNENKIDDKTQEVKTNVESKDVDDKKLLNIDKASKRIPSDVSKDKITEQKTINRKKNSGPAVQGKGKPGNNKKISKPGQKKVVALTDADLAILSIDDPKTVKDTATAKDIDDDNVNPDKNQNFNPTNNKIDAIKVDTLVKKVDVKKDSLAKKVDSVLKAVAVDSPIVNIPKKPSNKTWKWGAQFIPGISFLNENGFSISMEKSADALNYQNPSSGSGTVAPGQKPSEVKPGFAFQLGGFIQRQLTQKTNLSLGLQYGFYSTRIGIGLRRDSLLRFANLFSSMGEANSVYNAGGDTIHYTNRYHFIELPLRFQWQLNKNKTWPISWNAGASVSYLFATNALMYDTAFNGIYYQNKKLLNRTQLSLSTGISFTIANNRRMQWGLGPFIDFHLNKLVDNPFERKKYLLFTGVRTSVLFNSKK